MKKNTREFSRNENLAGLCCIFGENNNEPISICPGMNSVFEIRVKLNPLLHIIEKTHFQLRPILPGLQARVCHWADKRR